MASTRRPSRESDGRTLHLDRRQDGARTGMCWCPSDRSTSSLANRGTRHHLDPDGRSGPRSGPCSHRRPDGPTRSSRCRSRHSPRSRGDSPGTCALPRRGAMRRRSWAPCSPRRGLRRRSHRRDLRRRSRRRGCRSRRRDRHPRSPTASTRSGRARRRSRRRRDSRVGRLGLEERLVVHARRCGELGSWIEAYAFDHPTIADATPSARAQALGAGARGCPAALGRQRHALVSDRGVGAATAARLRAVRADTGVVDRKARAAARSGDHAHFICGAHHPVAGHGGVAGDDSGVGVGSRPAIGGEAVGGVARGEQGGDRHDVDSHGDGLRHPSCRARLPALREPPHARSCRRANDAPRRPTQARSVRPSQRSRFRLLSATECCDSALSARS